MQVVWLKVELSKLLEEKRSAILRLTFSPRNQFLWTRGFYMLHATQFFCFVGPVVDFASLIS